MRKWAMGCVVILATVGTACSKGSKQPPEGGVSGKTDGPPKKELTVDLGGGVKIKFVLIPAGSFMMGSSESAEELAEAFKPYEPNIKADVFKDEYPQHKVRITKPFYLGAHEVTVGQFRAFVQSESYKTDAEKDGKGGYGMEVSTGNYSQKPEYTWRNPGFPQDKEHPVVNVSHNDAVSFCRWLSQKEVKEYRLPTEAQWEYACRAGTQSRYYHGDDPEGLAAVGNVSDGTFKAKFKKLRGVIAIAAKDGYVFTATVGRFTPNAFGLYDMHGNVWEWCADWYGKEYYGASPSDDPTGPTSGSSRVDRGGSWGSNARSCRSAVRNTHTPDDRFYFLGFRVASVPVDAVK